MQHAIYQIAFCVMRFACEMRLNDEEYDQEETMRTAGWRALLALTASAAVGVSGAAMAQSGGNGNGGSGGGNAHGAATAGPTAGGDNTSAPGSTHQGGFHFKHKKKAKPPATTPQ
jgi:hypothetical protein